MTPWSRKILAQDIVKMMLGNNPDIWYSPDSMAKILSKKKNEEVETIECFEATAYLVRKAYW